MTFSRSLFGCLALLATTTIAFAAVPATNAPSAAPASANKANDNKAPAAAAQKPAPTGLTLDAYIKDLTTELKLSDTEKQQIEGYYLADGDQLKKILNDDTLSPLQQAQQVSDLRDTRNAKIKVLLDDLDRQQEFLKIEAQYRVALTILAADGGLVAAAPPAAK